MRMLLYAVTSISTQPTITKEHVTYLTGQCLWLWQHVFGYNITLKSVK